MVEVGQYLAIPYRLHALRSEGIPNSEPEHAVLSGVSQRSAHMKGVPSAQNLPASHRGDLKGTIQRYKDRHGGS